MINKINGKTYNTVSIIKIIGIVSFIFSVCFILDSCKKGDNDSDLEISGGKVITDADYPSVVRLDIGCTGSIISSNTVLTAAHCTKSTDRRWVYKDQNHGVLVQTVKANPNFIQEHQNFSYDKSEENYKNDIAIWVIAGRAFKNHPQKLQLSDISPKDTKDEVRLVGWGCYTKMITEAVENFPQYKKYTRKCDENRESDKRTGTNTDLFVSEDDSSITIYDDAVDKINGIKQGGSGVGVLTAPGDSGSPWLIEEGISSNKIIGVHSNGSSEMYDVEYCSKAFNHQTDFRKFKECSNLSSTAINPVSSYNMPFLKDMVDNHQAIIPGIQIGLRVVEYNGRVKVLYKEESTSFNQNVVEHKVISKFNNNTYKTINDLKQAWRATNFYDRSKAQWSFE